MMPARTTPITAPGGAPITGPATGPATEPITEPTTEPITEPTTEPTTDLPTTLAGFRDRHRGGTIVVCGCGTSLNELPATAGLVTIGVNDVGRRFDPTYLVVVNGRGQFSGDRFQYVVRSRARAVFSQLDLGIPHPRQVRFRLGRRGGTELSDPEVLHYTRNSPYVAVCLAVHLGATRIGLIGVDFTEDHFFGATGTHPLARELAVIDREYAALGAACAARGVALINLSARSRLAALPKVSPEVFLGPTPGGATAPPARDGPRVFFVHYRFQTCGEVFKDGLHHAARDLGLAHAGCDWDDPDLPARVRDFGPDLLFVVHGRRFAQRWAGRFDDLDSAVWLLDEPYEVDDTARWSRQFKTVFVNDPATLTCHRNAHYLPVAFDAAAHRPGEGERDLQVGFVGGTNARRERLLRALAEAGLLSYVVGGPWRAAALRGCCLATNLPAAEVPALYRRTRIVVNVFRDRHHFNRRRIGATSLNPRVYEALACGALVVSEPRPEATRRFPGLPLFDDEASLVALVRRLLDDQDAYRQTLMGLRRALGNERYTDRLATILEITLGREPGADPTQRLPPPRPRGSAPRPIAGLGARHPAPSGPTRTPGPFTAMPVRNLLFHLWPVRGAIWRWNLDQLLRRIDLFNGRRLVAIVHDQRSEDPQAVMDYLEGQGCEYLVEPNRPGGESLTFPRLLREVASVRPDEISFYAHGKGVKYEPEVPQPVRRWAEVQYRAGLDDWLGVCNHLQRYALTGPIKRTGRYQTHRRLADWHYCGTFFWLRHAAVFDRAGLDVPAFYGGVEAWPGIHFGNHEAGCLLLDAQHHSPYQAQFWRTLGDPAEQRWTRRVASVPVPPELATPKGLDGYALPRTEQKPEELAWWIGLLLQHGVRSLLVIGSGHGGVEWHVARIFRARGQAIALTSVDLGKRPELEDTLASIRHSFSQTARLVGADSTAPDLAERLEDRYDAVFIDGDHGYRAVHRDWTLARKLGAGLVGFHDIVDSHWHAQNRCCVSRLWREIAADYPTLEQGGDDWGGIGVVVRPDGGWHV